jgi:alpha-tubulin suppressor-like RCC1 family protein
LISMPSQDSVSEDSSSNRDAIMTSVWRWVAAAGLLAISLVTASAPTQAADYQYFRMYGGGSGAPGGGQTPLPGYTISTVPNSFGTVGVAYLTQFSATGGAAPYTFATTSALPPGLTLNDAGALSGTPSSVGSYQGIVVTATDALARTVSTAPFRIVISNPLSITWTPAFGRVGDVYVPTLPTASGGRAPYLYSLNAQAPDGLTFNNQTGGLTGIPLIDGIYSTEITVIDTDGRVAKTGPQTLMIAPGEIGTPQTPLTLSGTPAASAQVGVGYLSHYTATGGTIPYTFTLVAGTLPDGLTLASDGTISGIPTAVGASTGLEVAVTDATSTTIVSPAFSITVTEPAPLVLAGSPPAAARVGELYSGSLTAFDGTGAGYTFTSVGNELPPGLTLTAVNGSDVQISGTPTHIGTYSGLQIEVTDSAYHTARSQVFSITVAAPAGPAIALHGSPPAYADIGVAFNATFTATGGTGSGYVYSISSGALPDGLVLSPSGSLSGVPTTAQQTEFAVQVLDSAGDVASQSYSLTITAPLTLAGVPDIARPGTSYEFDLTTITEGGAAPYSYALVSGSLPSGMTLAASGAVSATSVTGSTKSATIMVTDAGGRTSSASLTFAVIDLYATAALTAGSNVFRSGQTFSGTLNTNVPEPIWTFASTPTTPSVTIDALGTNFSGTAPSVTALTTFQITAKAAKGSMSAAASPFSIDVRPALAVSNGGSSLFTGITGGSISTPPTTTADTNIGQMSYALMQNGSPVAIESLCQGLAFDAIQGSISGTANASCSATNLSIRGTDAGDGATATTTAFSIAIDPAIVISGTPPAATLGTVYNFTPTVSGGSGSYPTFSIANTSGTIAALGLSFNNATGSISGTPSAAGTWTGTITVTDSHAHSKTSSPLSITATKFPLAFGGVPPRANQNVVYGFDLGNITRNGRPPYAYQILSGSLPAGLSLSGANVTGTPTASGSSSLSIRVTDADSTSVTSSVVFTVDPAAAPLYGAGYNAFGQVGDGTTQDRQSFVAVTAGAFRQVSAGFAAVCGVTSSGGAQCWGQSSSGEFGDGTLKTTRTSPGDVPGLTSGVTRIAVGTDFVCALVNGGVKCWGNNNLGQLGNGTFDNSLTPTDVVGLTSGVVDISARSYAYHTCALLADGTMKCWGNNSGSELGNGGTTNSNVPVSVPGLAGITRIVASRGFTCALINGAAKCWGVNNLGQIGIGTTSAKVSTPTTVIASGVTEITAGLYSTCAVVSGGLKCWGANPGDGITPIGESVKSPVNVSGMASGVTTVSSGNSHTCGIRNGQAYCWGNNSLGQLGVGDKVNRTTATPITGAAPSGSLTRIEVGPNNSWVN